MALSTRELYLVLRARDEASRVLRNVSGSIRGLDKQVAEAAQRNMHNGQALATMGVAIGAAGAIGLQALNSMADAAIEYNNEAAKTLTQTDKFKSSVKELADIGRSVAKDIAVPFEQVQSTMYDIFSSMDVNVAGMEKLTRQFARDSVGGATDIQTAGRAVIEILNAWDIPVKNVTRISDVMFQLVRKGVGTYQEFARTIGRSIPSAVAAGQSVEDLAGAIAFLTRRGLSTAMASTAMGRAFDALANPKSIQNLKSLGVQVVDAKGKFRPLVDIVNDMNKKTENMSKPEKTRWLKDAFKGSGGTIQAMRFFNHALNDQGNLLDTLTADMKHAKGAAADAYKIMANTPAAKIQVLKNRFQILRTEIGDHLIPVKMLLVTWLTKLFDWWDKLSPKAKDLAVKIALIASALAVVTGIVITVAGIFLMFSATLAIVDATLGAFLLPVGIVVGAIVALGVVIYEMVKHWDVVKPAIERVGAALKGFATGAINAVVKGAIWLWDNLKKAGEFLWGVFGPTLIEAWNQIKDAGMQAWNAIKDAVMVAWNMLKPAFSDFMTTLKQLWAIFGGVLKSIWTLIKPFVMLVLGLLVISLITGIKTLAAIFVFLATVIKNVLPPVIKLIGAIIEGVWNIIKNFVGLVYSLMKGDWSKAWEYAKKLVGSIVATIINIITGLLGTVLGLIKGLVLGVIKFFKSLWDQLVGHSIVPDIVRGIIMWFQKLPGALLAAARQSMDNVVAKFREGWTTAKKVMSDGVTWIKDKFNDSKTWLTNAGKNIIAGLKSGISDAISGISTWIKSHIVDPIVTAVKNHFGIKSPSKVMAGLGGHLLTGLLNGMGSIPTGTWVSKIFGGFPSALGSLLNKGIVQLKQVPQRFWDTVAGLGGKFSGMVKKARDALAGAIGNLGGGGKKMSGSIIDIARKFGPSYIAGHRDPQGGPAYDIGSSGAKNNAIANALRANHARLGLRYVISQMRIASARSGWNWRRYTPITNQGDFRHVGHVHVSYANGGWIREHILGIGQRTGKTYQFGEGGKHELVTPANKVSTMSSSEKSVSVPITIHTQEIDPVKHAADLGWLLGNRVAS